MNLTPEIKNNSLKQAIEFLRSNRPLRAEELCRDYLIKHQGCTHHMRLLGHSLIAQNRLIEAEEQLKFAIELDPDFPHLYEDLGSILSLQSRFNEAIPLFQKAIALLPTLPHANKKLGEALAAEGRGEDADLAFEEYIEQNSDRADVIKGIELQRAGKHDDAIVVFRSVLKRSPDNINALKHLAGAYWQEKNNFNDAEALLRRATQISASYYEAWHMLGCVLMEQNKYVDAIKTFTKCTRLEPKDPDGWTGLGNAYGRAMYPEKSAEAFKQSLAIKPDAPHVNTSYAHELKTIGDQAGALKAYRNAIKLRPDLGEVYWSMANLKIFKFENEEVDAMKSQLQNSELSETSQIHFNFALAKSLEDVKDYDNAWHYYHQGNQKQRMTVEHDPLEMEGRNTAIKNTFSKTFMTEKKGVGHSAPDPIFIVGLPRSGSTLIEQIIASHSQVEGTSELPLINKISDHIGRYRNDSIRYPEAVAELRNKDLVAYGKQYIEESQRHRMSNKPFFTDKLPNNFSHIGFIKTILPNAKIINARRHPFDSCLGGYKQLFGRGQNFTYDMFDLAHYYKEYDLMMKHWHSVLPGEILDVHYEVTVIDLEHQVRQVLDFCNLPFEEECLRFYENERAVKTASSEQVRQPIYTGGLGKWRHYEQHLDLWKDQLGYIIDELPEVSKNAGL